MSTSDFLPTHPIFLSRGNVLPFVSTFLTVSIIVKRMVELWRFFHIPPHCSRFHRQRKYLPSPRNQSTKLPSFLSFFFFLSSFYTPIHFSLPHSLFFIKIIHLGQASYYSQSDWKGSIGSMYSKQLEPSMKLSSLRNFRFYRGIGTSPFTCLSGVLLLHPCRVSNDGELVLFAGEFRIL